jgi:hypothetical protein
MPYRMPAPGPVAVAVTAAVAGTVAVALTGCAGTPSPTSSGTTAPSAGAATPGGAAPAGDAEPAGRRLDLEFADGQVHGDTGRIPVAAGEPVTVTVAGDVADELHLHGYDLSAEVLPGAPATLSFDATIPGVFALELHEAGTVLVTLQIG